MGGDEGFFCGGVEVEELRPGRGGPPELHRVLPHGKAVDRSPGQARVTRTSTGVGIGSAGPGYSLQMEVKWVL